MGRRYPPGGGPYHIAILGNAEYAPAPSPGGHRPQRTGPGAMLPCCANLPAPAPGWRSVESWPGVRPGPGP